MPDDARLRVLRNTAVDPLGALAGALDVTGARLFQLLFCAWVAATMLSSAAAHRTFYDWFHTSDISLAKKRGLGAHPTKVYGLFAPPHLTSAQFRAVGAAFTACLLASLLPLAPRPFLFAAFLLSLVYFPQLYAEATTSGHGPILVPSLLLLLSCCPALNLDDSGGAAASSIASRSSTWTLVLIRIYISSGYFSSGLAKLLAGIRFNRFWGRGTTLQHYLFDGMWSRPPQSAFTRATLRALMVRPRLLTLFATGAMCLEMGFAAAPFSAPLALLLGANGFVFHASILWLQGIDFVSFWMPALFAYLVPAGELADSPWTVLAQAERVHESWFFVPAAVYTLLQVFTALTLYDLWLDDILPFSCCPMFMPPRNPFDRLPKWYIMTTAPLNGSTRRVGAMEPLYWSPASSVFHLSADDYDKLPQRVVCFGSTTNMPPEALKYMLPQALDKPYLVFSNFELSAELKVLMRKVVGLLNSRTEADAWDAACVRELLDLHDATMSAFDKCTCKLPSRLPEPSRNGRKCH